MFDLLSNFLQFFLGYRLRKSLAKALKRRSTALNAALKRYNDEAAALIPPKSILTFRDITSYQFLSEVSILRESRDDIRSRPWAIPEVRHGMNISFKLTRAKEELQRLDQESMRLKRWIVDQFAERIAVIQRIVAQDRVFAMELQERHLKQLGRDAVCLTWLLRMEGLVGFTGTHGVYSGETPFTVQDVLDRINGEDPSIARASADHVEVVAETTAEGALGGLESFFEAELLLN
jgi:hypothetical protein